MKKNRKRMNIKTYLPKPIKALFPKKPSAYQMLIMEKRIQDIILPEKIHEYSDKKLARCLHIKVEYVEPILMPLGVAAVLLPPTQRSYNAIIKVRANKEGYSKDFLMPEIARYLMHKKEDGRIDSVYIRYYKERKTDERLKRDCMVRMIKMPFAEIKNSIIEHNRHNANRSYMPLIRKLSKKYRVQRAIVTQRLEDIMKMHTSGAYMSYLSAIQRTDFLKETKELRLSKPYENSRVLPKTK